MITHFLVTFLLSSSTGDNKNARRKVINAYKILREDNHVPQILYPGSFLSMYIISPKHTTQKLFYSTSLILKSKHTYKQNHLGFLEKK